MENDTPLREIDFQSKMMTESMKALTELLKTIYLDKNLKFNDKQIDKGMLTLLKYAQNSGEIGTVIVEDTMADILEMKLKENRIPYGKLCLNQNSSSGVELSSEEQTNYIYLIRGNGINEYNEPINDIPKVEKIIKTLKQCQTQTIDESPTEIMRRRRQQRKEQMKQKGL